MKSRRECAMVDDFKWKDEFKRAYNYLSSNSILLSHGKDAEHEWEVWETGTQLLTIVLFEEQQFWTKTKIELGDEKYEECKTLLMK